MWGKGEERSPGNGVCVAVDTVSVRPAVAVRPEHVEAADRLLLLRSHSAGHCEAAGGREPFQPQWGECEASWPLRCGKEIQDYLAGSSRCLLNGRSSGTGLRRGMGSGGTVLGLVATSSTIMMCRWFEIPPWVGFQVKHNRAPRWVRVPRRWVGYLVKRTVRFGGLGKPAGAKELNTPMPQRCPSRLTFGRARLNPSGQSILGGRSESNARSYAPGPESRDGTLQVSRAGNAGKSLTTQSSIRPG